MQLWKTSTERMPVKSRHSHSGKHHGYDANCAVFPKYVNQPQISETHRHHRHSNRCRFAMHLHTLLPTLGQSSCSRGHRLVDSLSGRATCACPPSKKLIGWAPEPVANTQRLHEFHHIGPCKQSNSSNGPDQTQTVQIICQTGINQLSPATYHSLKYIPSSADKHQPTMRSLGMLTSGSIFLRHSHSFFIL